MDRRLLRAIRHPIIGGLMAKHVSIFSTFYSIDRAYSLTIVVEEQIKMLVEQGYDIDVIVTEGFRDPDGYFAHPKVHLRYLPDVTRSNEGELPPDYEAQVDRTEKALGEALKDIDVVISHDVVYQPAHLIFNLAARRIADKRGKSLRWLHWIHSATSPSVRCSDERARQIIGRKFPHSFICYPNAGDRWRVAKNFGVEEDEVKTVHHATDIPDYLGFHPLSTSIYRTLRLDEKDYITNYPIRLDRGKQVEYVIKTLGALRKIGRSVGGVILDFHSTGGDKVTYRNELKALVANEGLANDVIFTSEFDKSLEYMCPRQMVRDFMLVSNFYVHPSTSETYSFTTQEAAIGKNILVLNRDFPPMRSVWGDIPLYKQFSSAIDALSGRDGSTTTKYDNIGDYFHDLAMAIAYHVEHNPALMMNKLVRQTRNSNYIFRNQLEPLLFYEEQ